MICRICNRAPAEPYFRRCSECRTKNGARFWNQAKIIMDMIRGGNDPTAQQFRTAVGFSSMASVYRLLFKMRARGLVYCTGSRNRHWYLVKE